MLLSVTRVAQDCHIYQLRLKILIFSWMFTFMFVDTKLCKYMKTLVLEKKKCQFKIK